MDPSTPTKPPLDRRSDLRRNTGALDELQRAPETRFMILADGRAAIEASADRTRARIRWFSAETLVRLGIVADTGPIFLGLDTAEGAGRFALTLSEADTLRHVEALKPAVDFRSLVSQGVMSSEELGTIALAKSLVHWNARTLFCGACASPTNRTDGGWKRICPACAAEWFPRVDPVVVMLVSDGARAVLAREPHFPPGMYSALAGFVEPGEDIAGAVARETLEEVGLEAHNIRFAANQPWPMPHSLMIGCFAEASSVAPIRIDATEIEDARWFSRDDVAAMLAGSHPERLWLPPRQAIANNLIRRWLAGHHEEPFNSRP